MVNVQNQNNHHQICSANSAILLAKSTEQFRNRLRTLYIIGDNICIKPNATNCNLFLYFVTSKEKLLPIELFSFSQQFGIRHVWGNLIRNRFSMTVGCTVMRTNN